MTSNPEPGTPDGSNAAQTERLLAETGWVQQLARSLVVGQDRADDVAQETLVRALGQPLGPIQNLRAWLAVVARHVALRTTRAERRQGQRLAGLPPRDPEPSVAEVFARTALQRDVMDAALRLPEPYRATLLLRFQGGLGYAAIASQLQVPIETVRTRLKRGLRQLREELDSRHGSTRAWAVPMLGAALAPSATSLATVATGVCMGMIGKVVAVVLVVGLLGWWMVHDEVAPVSQAVLSATAPDRSQGDAPPAATTAVASDRPGASSLDSERTSVMPSGARLAVVSPALASSAAAPSEQAWQVIGRVVDAGTARPVPLARVSLGMSPLRFVPVPVSGSVQLPEVTSPAQQAGQGTTGSDGAFRLDLRPSGFDELLVEAPGRATTRVILAPWLAAVEAGPAGPGGSHIVDLGLVTVHEPNWLTGRVVAADGRTPVPEAELVIVRESETLMRVLRLGVAGRDGYFACASPHRLDADDVAIVAKSVQGSGWVRLPAPGPDLVIRLRPCASCRCAIVDERGAPIAGAIVTICGTDWPGDRPRICDGATDCLPRLSWGASTDAAGFANLDGILLGAVEGPAEQRRLAVTAAGYRCQQRPIVLQPGDNGAVVTLERGTSMDVRGTVVDAPHGQPIVGARVTGRGAGTVRTDVVGRFDLEHCDANRPDDELVVEAEGFVTSHVAPPEADAAGLVEIVVPLTPGAAVRGHVRDQHGAPVAGVRIEWRHDARLRTTTDAAGHFELGPLPHGPLALRFVPPFGRVVFDGPVELDVPDGARQTIEANLRRHRP